MNSSSFFSQSPSSSSTTYYDVLQISPTASPLDIKKAYRRLALQYHPDRNSDPSAKELFQQVGQAYACLSDPIQRRDYDRQLQQEQQHKQQVPVNSTSTTSPSFATSNAASTPHHHKYHHYHSRHPVGIDAWTQFDFLFHNDPFFRDYFENPERVQQELDDLKRAATTTPSPNPVTTPSNTINDNNPGANSRNSSSSRIQPEGWLPWLLRQCGIQFTMTTIVQDGNGRIHAKQVSSTPSSIHNHGSRPSARHQVSPLSSSSSAKSTTTIQQETMSYMENGQRVWIKKRQLQGTLIEDKIVGNTLVERRVNGVSVPLQQQQHMQQQAFTTVQQQQQQQQDRRRR